MKKKLILIIGILIVVAVTCCSCSSIASFWNSNGSTGTTSIHIDIDDLDSNSLASVVATNCINSCVRVIADFTLTAHSTQEAAGSGFIITSDGYVITNRHVVVMYSNGSDEKTSATDVLYSTSIKVVFPDNTYYYANRVAFSTDIDIAILKITGYDSDTTFTPLELDQTTQVYYGQQMYTIGNPENVGLVMSSMMVSSPSVKLSSTATKTVILLDGNVNHGNSGGALINNNSKVVGVVFARIESTGSTVNDVYGLGCAIPISDVISYIKSTELKSLIDYTEYIPEDDTSTSGTESGTESGSESA